MLADSNLSEAMRVLNQIRTQIEAQDYTSAAKEDFVTVQSHLSRLRSIIEKVFGAESSYLRDLKHVQFRYARATKKNAITYFERDQRQAINVIIGIQDEVRLKYPDSASDIQDSNEMEVLRGIAASLAVTDPWDIDKTGQRVCRYCHQTQHGHDCAWKLAQRWS